MRVHLVDGTYELFRAHFSPRPSHVDAQGRDRKATVGLVGSLLSLLHDAQEAVTHIAVAFDRTVPSFRNRLFDGYKTWDGIDPALLEQLTPAEDAVRALGVTAWALDTHEADDLMATGAARFRDQVEQVRIMTPDKDLLQCVRGERVVRVDRMRNKVTHEAAMREERGFGPPSIPDFLALVGDDADGIPGLAGFGERGASVLLSRFVHLEAIPQDPAQWGTLRGANALSQTLRAHWEEALLYRKLATLDEDAPLPMDLASIEFKGVPPESFKALCAQLGSETLANRPQRWAQRGSSTG